MTGLWVPNSEETFDRVLMSGTVVDGTGGSPVDADVGIIGDRIAAVGSLRGYPSRHTVDVSGLIVCPGFIDPHSHSEVALLRGEVAEARLRQGITTDLLSPDGFAYVPTSPQRRAEVAAYLEVFNGEVDSSWNLNSPAEYLDLFDRRVPINVVPQVGFLALRAEAVGWDPRPATPSERRRMESLTRQGMELGASGIQVGLDYFPSGHADFEELAGVARVVAEYGGVYSTHVRGIRGDVAEGVEEALRVGRETGVAVHISHLFGSEELYRCLTSAREEGVDVTFDAYPYMAASSHLAFCLPGWFDDGPPEHLIRKLTFPAVRTAVAPYIEQFFHAYVQSPRNAFFSALPPGPFEELSGRPLADAIGTVAPTLAEAVCTLLAECRLRVLMVYRWDDPEKLNRAMTHPLSMIGSDGLFRGQHPHPRGFGTHARVLARLVRGQELLTMPDAIRRMTSMPARRYSLADRGVIQPGAAADIAVFDPKKIRDRATFKDGRAPAEGMHYVFVNGRPAIESGTLTDTTAGRVLYRS